MSGASTNHKVYYASPVNGELCVQFSGDCTFDDGMKTQTELASHLNDTVRVVKFIDQGITGHRPSHFPDERTGPVLGI